MKLSFILCAVLCVTSPLCFAQDRKAPFREEKKAPAQPVTGKVHPGFKEPVLTKQPADSKLRVYRLVIAPVWGPLYCMRVQNTAAGATITVKHLKYEKENPWKELVEEKPVTLTAAEFAEFEALIAKTGYEKMGPKDYGVDGDIWALEVSKAGYFHKAERWCPNAFDPEKKGTAAYAAAFRWVADKVQVTAKITNKGRPVFDRN
jgi:hypothetical protein